MTHARNVVRRRRRTAAQQRSQLRTPNPLTIAFWDYAVATVALTPFLPTADRILPHWGEVPWIVLLGVVFTGISGYGYVFLLGRVTAQAMGILSYIEPVSAAVLTWAILGQSFGWQVAVGGALVVLAGAIVVLFEPADVRPIEAPEL